MVVSISFETNLLECICVYLHTYMYILLYVYIYIKHNIIVFDNDIRNTYSIIHAYSYSTNMEREREVVRVYVQTPQVAGEETIE